MEKQLQKTVTQQNMTIKQVLKKMDESGKKIIFVLDSNNVLLGTVTDGDIRRWILKGRSLSDNVTKVMNKKPFFLKEGYANSEAEAAMLKERIECIPIVNQDIELISSIWWTDLFDGKPHRGTKLDIPIVIMAGGKGKRLSPLTQVIPKPLIPIGEKTIIETILDRFIEYGCKDFYLSMYYKFNIIRAYFNDMSHTYKLHYLIENKPLGTAGGLYLLRDKIKKTFCVSNCDVLIDADYHDILKFHLKNKNYITIVSSMKHFTIPYGVCEITNGGTLRVISEKPESDYLVNTGVYLLEPQALNDIPANTFYNMTDLINSYIQRGLKVGVYPISEKSWLDMGQWEELSDIRKNCSGGKR